MLIYEVLHRYDGGEEKSVGCFTTPEKAKAAIAQSMVLPGFCDHPSGYLIVPRAVCGPDPDGKTLWQAWVCFRDADDPEEHWTLIGFFSLEAEAAAAVDAWRSCLGNAALSDLCAEADYGSVFPDRLEWPEGFTKG